MAFRSSPPVAALVARWNLRAFAALRFQEVAGPVEEALRGSALRGLSDRPSARVGGRDVRSAWLRAGWEALQQCIALRDPVWGLPGLAERMVRIALQVRVVFSGTSRGREEREMPEMPYARLCHILPRVLSLRDRSHQPGTGRTSCTQSGTRGA